MSFVAAYTFKLSLFMKNTKTQFYFLILNLFFLQMYAQEQGIITFEAFNIERDSFANPLPNNLTIKEPKEFTLLFNKGLCYFEAKNYHNTELEKTKPNYNATKLYPLYYLGPVWSDSISTTKVMKNRFLKKSTMVMNNKQEWIMTDNYDTILNYRVREAYYIKKYRNKFTREPQDIKIKAWFTDELNFTCGPTNFHNLPGVILRVQYLFYEYIATAISFEEVQLPEMPKSEIVSQDEYEKLINNNVNREKLKFNDN